MTSMGAPPVVSRQKLLLQKYSFQSLRLISGNSFFSRRLLALLYAQMNFYSSVFGWARNSMCTWSTSWFHSSRVIP